MGIFAKFKEYRGARQDKRYERAVKLVKNAKAIKEDRWSAIETLTELDDPEKAIRGLLERFDYSLEHGIVDTREKELAMKGIVRFGKEALPYVLDKIKSTTRIAWPIKILKEVGSPEDIVETLKLALNYADVSFDQSAVDKNYDILCYLRDFQLGPEAERIAHFLNDPDERVRFACVETLIEQKQESMPRYLERFLADDSSENRRIKQAVIQAYLKNNWRVEKPEAFPEGQVDMGVYVSKSGNLEVRT